MLVKGLATLQVNSAADCETARTEQKLQGLTAEQGADLGQMAGRVKMSASDLATSAMLATAVEGAVMLRSETAGLSIAARPVKA